MLDGYSGMIIFIFLLWISNQNKPATFVICVVLGVLMVTGAI